MFAILDDKTGNLVESYTFRFSYAGGSANVSMESSAVKQIEKQDILSATLNLLSCLEQCKRVLPQDLSVTMKLYYYEAKTPKDYEPVCQDLI